MGTNHSDRKRETAAGDVVLELVEPLPNAAEIHIDMTFRRIRNEGRVDSNGIGVKLEVRPKLIFVRIMCTKLRLAALSFFRFCC